jgi:enoyl-CoA hydratase
VSVPEFETLLLEHEGPVAWLTLNRPEKLNAMNDLLLEELEGALDYLETAKNSVVVLQGAGRAFCAGYDLSSDSEEIGYASVRTPIEDRDRLLANIEVFTRIWRHPQPVIAAVHGYCVGGGTQLASLSDITIVSEDAMIMASPALLLGGGYLSPLWVHLVGPNRAKFMSFDTGRPISGKIAADWGWAVEAVPFPDFHKHVSDLAHSIARTPANVLRIKKESINRAAESQGLLTYARMGAETDALLHQTAEVQEVQRWIRDFGLKEAISMFKAGALSDFGEESWVRRGPE